MGALITFLLGFAAGVLGAIRWLEGQMEASPNDEALSDEQVAARVRDEWRRLGLLADHVSVTIVDGVTHLQGTADAVTAETLRSIARGLPGVGEVRDEVTRSS